MSGPRNKLLEVANGVGAADDTLRIARGLVCDAIGGGGCDVDSLTTISCVLDRVNDQLRKAGALADAMRKESSAAG